MEITRDVHVYVPAEPGTTLHIHITPPGVIPRDDAGEVADMLVQLVKIGGPGIQAAYDGLAQLGYEPELAVVRKPGKPREKYIRWNDPATGGAACTAYLTPTNVDFARAADQARLASKPGAVPGAGHVAFSLGTAEGVRHALAAAASVKGG